MRVGPLAFAARQHQGAARRVAATPPARPTLRALPSGPAVATLLAFATLLAGATPAARAELAAGRLSAATFAEHAVGGPDADAGIGDWFLGNGTLCAALSDPDHESPLTPRGGVLIDLGHCGRTDDQWSVLQPLLNLAQGEVVPVESIAAGRDAERAWLQTYAVYNGVELVTTYALDEATPTALSIALRARRIAPGARVFGLGAIAMHAGGQLAPFSLSRREPDQSRGFVHPANDRSSTRRLLASLADADVTVLVAREGMPPISYGIERVAATVESDGRRRPLSSFSITGGHYSLENVLVAPPWIGPASGRPGLLQMAQIPFMDVDAGEALAVDYRIWVGERADVASVTDALFARAPRVRGRIDDPRARIHFERASGAPISERVPDPDGRYALQLPPGAYRAVARAPAGREVALDFEVPAPPAEAGDPGVDLPLLALGAPASVELPEDFIGRLVFVRADGSSRLRFDVSLLGARVGDDPLPSGIEADALNVARPPAERRRVPIEPGAYRVLAVRGPEYAARELSLELGPGETRPLALAPLERIAPARGWIAADLHVHSGRSFDSSLPTDRQIEAFAASGAEVLVSTEHDTLFDPRAAIARAGLAGELVGIAGSEMTSTFHGGDSPHTTGHLNAFPLEPSPTAYRRGALRLEGRRLRDVLAELAGRDRPPFVQLNHPRPDPRGGDDDAYLDHLAVAGAPFDPTQSLDVWPNSVLLERAPDHGWRDLDFDALELLNADSLPRYRRARADWLALLLQGVRLVATANSDSHRLGHVVGLPRTYVRLEDDRVEAFDEEAFLTALRAGRAYGTTGPLLDVRIEPVSGAEARGRGIEPGSEGDRGAGIGERYAGRTGVLRVAVSGADWVPVSEWRVYVDGALVHRAPLALGETAELPLVFARDAFVTVEVEGPAEGRFAEAWPGLVPFAFTNPIFVDADADARWVAPGLPARADLPETITRPEATD
ncbi:MAG: CehA/McbA family metallohydrolase [Myxococcota bacterium]